MNNETPDRFLLVLERIALALERIAAALSSPNGAGQSDVESPTNPECPIAAQPPATTETAEGADASGSSSRTDALHDFLAGRGIGIKHIPPEREYDEVLDRLALFIGNRYDTVRRVYDAIKGSMNTGRLVRLDLRNAAQREIADTCQLCTQLHEIAFLEEYKYFRSPRFELLAKPSRNPKALNFFSGQWLERYAHKQVVSTCEAAGQRYTRIMNPQINLPNGDDFELDLLFAIEDDIFWFEAKTGDYQRYIEKYSRMARFLALEPSRAFLILTDVSEATAKNLQHLFGMTVVAISRFQDELERVLPEVVTTSEA